MLETTIAGSLPKPSWLAKPRMLWAPWQLEGEALVEAKRDATLLALKEQEDAWIDIVTDGEQARQHFVHGFLEHIEGVDFTRGSRWASAIIAMTRKFPLSRDRFAENRASIVSRPKLPAPTRGVGSSSPYPDQ